MNRVRRMASSILLAVFVLTFTVATPQPASAQTECRKTLESDVAACVAQKDACFGDPNWSWWTSTCNLQYILCVDTATLLYIYCGGDPEVAG